MAHGLHHTTGITGDAQANVDFYAGLLGLRLVMRTVNHEDPETLHLFYGDAHARPGTLVTFFAWPDTARGRRGTGQAAEIGLLIPRAGVGAWVERLLARGVRFGGPTADAERTLLTLTDPDGLPVILVGVPDAPAALPREGSDVPVEAAVRGLHHVTLWSDRADATGRILVDHLGFAAVDEAGPQRRYRSGAPLGHTVLVRDASGFWPAAGGVGSVHHVAFRVESEAEQARLVAGLRADGLAPSPMREHGFFRSTYLREPGGVLVEVATDGPGLTAGRSLEELGRDLVLPPEHEPLRSVLEVTLPDVAAPGEPRLPKRDLGWAHRFLRGTEARTLLLLHGSGGDETSLLAFGRDAAPGANLLGVRGRHDALGGGPRFVPHLERGDGGRLAAEAVALARFVDEAARLYGFDPERVIAVGHADGAAMAIASAARDIAAPEAAVPDGAALEGAVLLRPTLAPAEATVPDVHGTPVLVVIGEHDPGAPQGDAVVRVLEERGARVRVERIPARRAVSGHDLGIVREWLRGD